MRNTAWVLIALGAAILVGVGYWLFHTSDEAPLMAGDAPAAGAPEHAAGGAQVRHPITPAPAAPAAAQERRRDESAAAVAATPRPRATPLPALAQSDAPLLSDAQPIFGPGGAPNFLRPQALIEHFVVTVDNLDRNPIPLRRRPIAHVPEKPAVRVEPGEGAMKSLTAENTARYTPYVQALASLDVNQVAALYRRYYPLFQQAYRDMGYPQGYFNDRLVEIIDHLLATPRVDYPIAVKQPKVLYEFADPSLEERSWGQKSLIRLGPQNQQTVKTFLRALRAEIASGAE